MTTKQEIEAFKKVLEEKGNANKEILSIDFGNEIEIFKGVDLGAKRREAKAEAEREARKQEQKEMIAELLAEAKAEGKAEALKEKATTQTKKTK